MVELLSPHTSEIVPLVFGTGGKVRLQVALVWSLPPRLKPLGGSMRARTPNVSGHERASLLAASAGLVCALTVNSPRAGKQEESHPKRMFEHIARIVAVAKPRTTHTGHSMGSRFNDTYRYMGVNWSFTIPLLFGLGFAEPYLRQGQKTPGHRTTSGDHATHQRRRGKTAPP
jgi:hypothetical protein